MASHVITASLQGGDAVLRHLKTIEGKLGTGATVRVGFFESATYPKDEYHFTKARLRAMSPEARKFAQSLQGKKKFSGAVAQVAFWNELGTKKSPPRPFMRHTIASKSPRWGVALGAALRRNHFDARTSLAELGEVIQGQIQTSIQNWTSPPNSKITRELKGFSSPLRDTGLLYASVNYQVLEVGEDD